MKPLFVLIAVAALLRLESVAGVRWRAGEAAGERADLVDDLGVTLDDLVNPGAVEDLLRAEEIVDDRFGAEEHRERLAGLEMLERGQAQGRGGGKNPAQSILRLAERLGDTVDAFLARVALAADRRE